MRKVVCPIMLTLLVTSSVTNGITSVCLDDKVHSESEKFLLVQSSATGLVDLATVMTRLVQKHSDTCHAIPQIYQVYDSEISENRKVVTNEQSRNAILNFFDTSVKRALTRLQAIEATCVEEINYNCNVLNDHHGWNNEIVPQELQGLIELAHNNGIRMLQLLAKYPCDLVLDGLAKILDNAVRDLEVVGDVTSVGILYAQTQRTAQELQDLEHKIQLIASNFSNFYQFVSN